MHTKVEAVAVLAAQVGVLKMIVTKVVMDQAVRAQPMIF
jgi:hypothetical protein|tara:strand:- start:1227 stop:1343 length:117 start_codon:yes stop_codon:yes gene_type:complete